MRHVILHHHIFKNAGTTLDFALQRALGADFATIHDETDDGVVGEDRLLDFLRRQSGLRAISSHHFHGQDYGAHLRGDRYRIFDLALVRRPLSRLLSIYKFFRRSSGQGALELAAQRPAPDFMQLLIDRYPHFVNNAQVNLFANHGFYGRPVSDEDLSRALARFLSFSLCAPMERYDEAMVVLEYTLAPIFLPQQPDLAYVAQNVSERLPDEDNLRTLMGPEAFDWLQRVNMGDEALWVAADKELSRRILAVPNFERRLDEFRGRCERLRTDANEA
jgi:hypothetical protein